jgi:hypothetical protein
MMRSAIMAMKAMEKPAMQPTPTLPALSAM